MSGGNGDAREGWGCMPLVRSRGFSGTDRMLMLGARVDVMPNEFGLENTN